VSEFSDRSVLVLGTGIETAHAMRLAKDFGKVFHFTPYNNQKPKIKDFAPGFGLPGIIKTEKTVMGGITFENPIKLWDYIPKADLIYITDVGFGDIARAVKRYHPDKRVFGPDMGDLLEEDRYFFRYMQSHAMKLPTQNTKRLFGTDSLRSLLKKKKDVWVKLNQFRGDRETFKPVNDQKTDNTIAKIEQKIGPFKAITPIIVEDEIKNGIVEYGFDLFFNGKTFIKPYLWGIERSAPYLGTVTDKMPTALDKLMNALQPVLTKMNYRGAVSSEMILVSRNKGFFLDCSSRFAMPLSVIYTEAILNYSEVIWKVAGGEDVEIQWIAPYVGCLPLAAEEARTDWVQIYYDKKYSKFIKTYSTCSVEGSLHAVPGEPYIINLIAWGSSPNQVVNRLKGLMDKVDADSIEKDSTNLEKIMGDFKKLKEIGIDF